MQTECTPALFDFEPVERKKVVAGFDGGTITSDAGALLLGRLDRGLGLIPRMATCFTGRRDPGLLEHTVETLSDSRPARRARHGVGGATSGRNGPPPITRTTFPTCRAQYPGGSERVPMSVASPFHAAFPVSQAGRHPRFHFRGLLRLHSRYGPLDRSTAQGGLCHEASRRPVTQPPTLVSYQINRQLSGWYLPPLVIRAFGAH